MKQSTVSAMDFKKEWDASSRILANATGRVGEMVSKSQIMGKTIIEWKTSLSAFLGRLTPGDVQKFVHLATALTGVATALVAVAVAAKAFKGIGAVAGLLGFGRAGAGAGIAAGAGAGGAALEVAGVAGTLALTGGYRRGGSAVTAAEVASAGKVASARAAAIAAAVAEAEAASKMGLGAGFASGVAAAAKPVMLAGMFAAAAGTTQILLPALTGRSGLRGPGWASPGGKMAAPSDEDIDKMEGFWGKLTSLGEAIMNPRTTISDSGMFYSRTFWEDKNPLNTTVSEGMGPRGAAWRPDAYGNMSMDPTTWLASQKDVLSAVRSTMGVVAYGKATREAITKQLAVIDDAIANGIDNAMTKSQVEAFVTRRPEVVEKLNNSIFDGLDEVQNSIDDELTKRSKSGPGSMSKERLNELFAQQEELTDAMMKLGAPARGSSGESYLKRRKEILEKMAKASEAGGTESQQFRFLEETFIKQGKSPGLAWSMARNFISPENEKIAAQAENAAMNKSALNAAQTPLLLAFSEMKRKRKETLQFSKEDFAESVTDRIKERSLERIGGGGQIVSSEGVWGAAQSFEHAWNEKMLQNAAEQRADTRAIRDMTTDFTRDMAEIARLMKEFGVPASGT